MLFIIASLIFFCEVFILFILDSHVVTIDKPVIKYDLNNVESTVIINESLINNAYNTKLIKDIYANKEKEYLYVLNTVQDSIVDGPGIRYTIFLQGCQHFCEGCHNKQTWALFNKEARVMSILDIINEIKTNPLINGITVSGGEPLMQTYSVDTLLDEVKVQFPEYNIILYTGYTMYYNEWLQQFAFKGKESDKYINSILNKVDYIVDGEFKIGLKDIGLKYRGSSNQRIIDIKGSLKAKEIVLAEV